MLFEVQSCTPTLRQADHLRFRSLLHFLYAGDDMLSANLRAFAERGLSAAQRCQVTSIAVAVAAVAAAVTVSAVAVAVAVASRSSSRRPSSSSSSSSSGA